MEKTYNLLMASFTKDDWKEIKDDFKEFLKEDLRNTFQYEYSVDVDDISEILTNEIRSFVKDEAEKIIKENLRELNIKEILLKIIKEEVK